ncbi:MAG TPA: hypothetical protein VFD84_04145 [Candidatus Binatia bacterium]|jgi:hypothetical protein|nr:hypothetical protein [Candidatus Binatia bacterium]
MTAATVLALLGVALVVTVSLFVAAPLFGTSEAADAGQGGGERERWERRKRQALAAIKEIEDDHRMGKVSDEDLAGMRARFEAEALEAMAALERGPRT